MIAIVVPIKGQEKIVRYCLNSIHLHYRNEEVVLIDDGSDDITSNLIKEYALVNGWVAKRNDRSVGHTEASTQGIELSKSENIFLLNSDTILTKNSLYNLSRVLDQNKDVAVVGPCTSSASGKQLMPSLYPKRYIMSHEEIERVAVQVESEIGFEDIPLVNGFCYGLKRSVFIEVGGFDSILTCYGNEKELSVRIKRAGYRTVWVKNAYVHHFGKVTYSKEKIDIGRACIDADRYILKKHGG